MLIVMSSIQITLPLKDFRAYFHVRKLSCRRWTEYGWVRSSRRLDNKTQNLCSVYLEQALMLDLDMGSYPYVPSHASKSERDEINPWSNRYVTSSTTTVAGIIGGLTLNPRALTEVIGVVKACTLYSTRLVI